MSPDIAPNQVNIQPTPAKVRPFVIIVLTLIVFAAVIVVVVFLKMNTQTSNEAIPPTPVVQEEQNTEVKTPVGPATTEQVEAALGSVKESKSTVVTSSEAVQKELDRMTTSAGATPAPTTEEVEAVLNTPPQN